MWSSMGQFRPGTWDVAVGLSHTCHVAMDHMFTVNGCSPPARSGLLDFKKALRASSFFFSSSPPRLLASSWSLWALLDLNCQLPIPVGAAGPQQPSPDISGHCWTSTAGLSSPALDLSSPALNLNRGPPEPSRHRWKFAGTFWAQWALLDFNAR